MVGATAILGAILLTETQAAKPRYTLPQAVSVTITERGMQPFLKDLAPLLKSAGAPIERYQKKNLSFGDGRAISLATLPTDDKKQKNALEEVRKAVREWLVGVELKDPKPTGIAAQLDIATRDARLGLRIRLDETAKLPTDSMGRRQGVVVEALATFAEIRVRAESVTVQDGANAVLKGKVFGLKRPRVLMEEGDEPLEVTALVDLALDANSPTGLQAKVRRIRTNLRRAALDLSFDDLILPAKGAYIKVGTKKIELDPKAVADSIRAHETDLAKVLRNFAAGWLERSGPAKLTSALAGALKKMPEGLDLQATGAAEGDEPVKLGLKLNAVDANEERLWLGLEGYTDDPLITGDDNPGVKEVRDYPSIATRALDEFDTAIALDLAVINRLVFSGYARGSTKFTMASGELVELASAPMIIGPGAKPGHAIVNLRVIQRPGWVENIPLVDPYVCESLLDIRFEPSEAGRGFDVVADHILPETAHVPDYYLRFELAKKPIQWEVNRRIAKFNQGFKTRTVLSENVPVVEVVAGVPAEVTGVEIDPAGFLVFFVDFVSNWKTEIAQ